MPGCRRTGGGGCTRAQNPPAAAAQRGLCPTAASWCHQQGGQERTCMFTNITHCLTHTHTLTKSTYYQNICYQKHAHTHDRPHTTYIKMGDPIELYAKMALYMENVYLGGYRMGGLYIREISLYINVFLFILDLYWPLVIDFLIFCQEFMIIWKYPHIYGQFRLCGRMSKSFKSCHWKSWMTIKLLN